RLQRGVFRSVDDLKAAINRFVTENNASPKLIVWTADPRRPRHCQTRETPLGSVHRKPHSEPAKYSRRIDLESTCTPSTPFWNCGQWRVAHLRYLTRYWARLGATGFAR